MLLLRRCGLPDGSLRYLDSAPDDAVRPVAVLLHGSGGNGQDWCDVIAALAPRWRVIAPDRVGYGATPAPGAAPCLADEGARLLALASRIGRPFHLVAHGAGGIVALAAAAALGTRLRSLVLYEPWVFHLLREAAAGAWDEIETHALWQIALAEAGEGRVAAEAFAGYWMAEHALALLPAELRLVLIAAMPRIAADWRMALAAAAPADYRAIGCPTLLLCGAASPPPMARVVERLAALIPGATSAQLAGLGHMAPVTDGQAVAAPLVAFLERAEGGDRDLGRGPG